MVICIEESFTCSMEGKEEQVTEMSLNGKNRLARVNKILTYTCLGSGISVPRAGMHPPTTQERVIMHCVLIDL